jgi:hypothetical protein
MHSAELLSKRVILAAILAFGTLLGKRASAQPPISDGPLAISTAIGMKTMGQRPPISLSPDSG